MLYDIEKTEVLIIISACLLGMAGALFMARYAQVIGIFDMPNKRSSHNLPTPSGGGIGILAAFVFAVYLLELPFATWGPAVLLSLISLYDDCRQLSSKVRLSAHILAAIAVIQASGVGAQNTVNGMVVMICWCVFIVATTNIYNFMDGINGIAGITGIIAFLLISFFSYLTKSSQISIILSISISLACFGFLPFNFPKARVFMGDVGSILLGFMYSVFVLWLSKSLADFICLISFLFPFYADALTTLYIRFHDGENITKAHRRHLYQLIANELKHPHWKTSLGYGVYQIITGILTLCAWHFGLVWEVLVLSAMLMVFIINMLKLRGSVRVNNSKA